MSVRVDRQILQRFYVAAAAEGINKRTAFAKALQEFAEARHDLLAALRRAN